MVFLFFQTAKIQKRAILRKMIGKIAIFAYEKQIAMSYFWVEYGLVIGVGMTVSFFLCCFFLYNAWMVPVLALSYLLLWTIAHRVSEANVNVRFTETAFVIRRLSGSKNVPDFREVVWTNVTKYSSGYKYIFLRENDNSTLTLYFQMFALFEKRKSRRDILNSFQNVFFKQVWKYKIPAALKPY